MALQISSGFFAAAATFSPRRVQRIRAVASTETEEGMAKLGGSELKVTKLGIGAWSWGDTSYWNNFEWDGKLEEKYSIALPEIIGFEDAPLQFALLIIIVLVNLVLFFFWRFDGFYM